MSNKAIVNKYLSRVVTNWDKFVFYSSLVGLLFLFGMSLYKNIYLKRLEYGVKDKKILYEKNKNLKEENERLQEEIYLLEQKLLKYEEAKGKD